MNEQPMPVPNERGSIQAMVREDLHTREQVGVQRCGTALQAHNGRDALRDAYEEALDLACYLRWAIEERDGGTVVEGPRLDSSVPTWRCRFVTAGEVTREYVIEHVRQVTSEGPHKLRFEGPGGPWFYDLRELIEFTITVEKSKH